MLERCVAAQGAGDRLFFTDWRGDPTSGWRPETEVSERLRRRGPPAGHRARAWCGDRIWTGCPSASKRTAISARRSNAAGGECLRDMRVRPGGSHHQKFVVLRHPDRPELDVAFVGGIDLCHSRHDDADHRGDPQRQPMAAIYGDRVRRGTTFRWRCAVRRWMTWSSSSANAGRTPPR